MDEKRYDEKDVNSIVNYARKLIGKTLSSSINQITNESHAEYTKVKGKFGQYLEKHYFGIKNNSDKEPDFKEAGLELKSTPLKKIKKGLVAKERLVLSIINYEEIIREDWKTSSFLEKNQLLLLVFYLYEKDKSFLDFLIKYVNIWDINENDLEIIQQDWKKIVSKIKAGKAHELSEGDTFYLSACRKGSGKGKDYRRQPGNEIKALQRAFSFKPKYMNFVISKISGIEPIIKNNIELKNEIFEDVVYNKFRQFVGLNNLEIEKRLKISLNHEEKAYPKTLALRMLGVKKKHVEEFEKGDIEFKTIRLNSNGTPKESISFPAFDFIQLGNEKWIDSDFFQQIQKKFFFIVYQMNKDKTKLLFKKAFFWNMPAKDIIEAEKVWNKTKNLVNGGLKTWEEKWGEETRLRNNFPNSTENPVTHVRPHGQNKMHTNKLPNGKDFTKQCFWLNSQYIKKEIIN